MRGQGDVGCAVGLGGAAMDVYALLAGERSDLRVREARAGRACAGRVTCVAASALSRHAVHRARVSLGADVAIATSSLGEYCFIIGAIAMVRQASRCHLIPLPRPPLALQTPRPSADPCHGLESAQVPMPITWASPAVRGRGNQPPGPGREARGGSVTPGARRRERTKVGDSSEQTAARSGRTHRDAYAWDGDAAIYRAGSSPVTRTN